MSSSALVLKMKEAVFCFLLFFSFSLNSKELIELDSPEGFNILRKSQGPSDYPFLIRFYTGQGHLAFCGVASSVIVLNSLGLKGPKFGIPSYRTYDFFTQNNLFTKAVSKVRSRHKVEKGGMSLEELSKILRASGASSKHFHAEDNKAFYVKLKKALLKAMGDPKKFILINYHRKTLGQIGGGHISPIAAYDQVLDKVLILDVSNYKYPSVWTNLKDLIKALATKDKSSGKNRGFVLVSR